MAQRPVPRRDGSEEHTKPTPSSCSHRTSEGGTANRPSTSPSTLPSQDGSFGNRRSVRPQEETSTPASSLLLKLVSSLVSPNRIPSVRVRYEKESHPVWRSCVPKGSFPFPS